ncbi:MAG: hypothetical protein BGO69_11560 [Bacteroidetes bacterium 46-16]|nr:MAG: hypothetical protein BGO69_11560 [Bacteroidetes bacterium 46-16]
MFNIPSATENRSSVHYRFFKAICHKGNHFLCDFSDETMPENKVKYLVDIEIPGHEHLHVEMYQAEDNKWHTAMPLQQYSGLEEVLDDAIYSYTVLN